MRARTKPKKPRKDFENAIAGDSISGMDIVLDTNVLVSALISDRGASIEVIRRCLQRRHQPCISLALFSEYQDLLGRSDLYERCPLTASERQELFNALMSVSRMTDIYYLWRPNLSDETDNHVLELAVAARAGIIVTHNLVDFTRSELRFPELRIMTPAQFLKETT
jgi:putative PIN family toxin of toxin-antitoxin system